jgi:hypothetical protein
MTDGYKIGQSYKDIPLDLSHFLLIRTREHLLLQNKLGRKVFKPTLFSSLTANYNNSAVNSVRRDLEEGMQCLYRLFYVEKKDYDMPVAFATNALYILARNGLAQTPESHKLIHEQLIPLILKK